MKTPSALDALDYALYICKTRKASFKSEAYNAACDDVTIFLEAARDRVENGEGLYDYAVVDEQIP